MVDRALLKGLILGTGYGRRVTEDDVKEALATFTQRHYEALATMMQRAHPQEYPENDNQWSRNQWGWVVDMLVGMLQQDNPKFNAKRFRKACQPGSNVKARKDD